MSMSSWLFRSITAFGLVILLILIGWIYWQKGLKISEAEAVTIAQQAIEGKATHHQGEPIEVEYQNNQYIVTFVHILPPNTHGADYDAQVTINARTGEVLEILGGS